VLPLVLSIITKLCVCSVRAASADVIASLVSAGADVNCRNSYKANITPLTLVLVRGTAVAAMSPRLNGMYISIRMCFVEHVLIDGCFTCR